MISNKIYGIAVYQADKLLGYVYLDKVNNDSVVITKNAKEAHTYEDYSYAVRRLNYMHKRGKYIKEWPNSILVDRSLNRDGEALYDEITMKLVTLSEVTSAEGPFAISMYVDSKFVGYVERKRAISTSRYSGSSLIVVPSIHDAEQFSDHSLAYKKCNNYLYTPAAYVYDKDGNYTSYRIYCNNDTNFDFKIEEIPAITNEENIHDTTESIYTQMNKIDDVESLSESVDGIVVDNEIVIPEPFDVYYTISNLDIDFDELPDAFDHYKGLKVVAEVVAKDEYDEALSDNGIEFCWLANDEGQLMLVTSVGLRVYPITIEEVQNCVDKSSYDDDYDDYDEEDFDEAVELTDAQRLAVDELDAALAAGEVNSDAVEAAKNVQWDINFEDVVLFINGINFALSDVKHVAYGDCADYDGCYSVTMRDGTIKKFGWYDSDRSGALYLVED